MNAIAATNDIIDDVTNNFAGTLEYFERINAKTEAADDAVYATLTAFVVNSTSDEAAGEAAAEAEVVAGAALDTAFMDFKTILDETTDDHAIYTLETAAENVVGKLNTLHNKIYENKNDYNNVNTAINYAIYDFLNDNNGIRHDLVDGTINNQQFKDLIDDTLINAILAIISDQTNTNSTKMDDVISNMRIDYDTISIYNTALYSKFNTGKNFVNSTIDNATNIIIKSINAYNTNRKIFYIYITNFFIRDIIQRYLNVNTVVDILHHWIDKIFRNSDIGIIVNASIAIGHEVDNIPENYSKYIESFKKYTDYKNQLYESIANNKNYSKPNTKYIIYYYSIYSFIESLYDYKYAESLFNITDSKHIEECKQYDGKTEELKKYLKYKNKYLKLKNLNK